MGQILIAYDKTDFMGPQMERLQRRQAGTPLPFACIWLLSTQGNGSSEGRAEVQEQYQDSVPPAFLATVMAGFMQRM